MSDSHHPPDGTWSPGPVRVDISIFENRHLGHVIEACTSDGKKRRIVLAYQERTPLHHSCGALNELIKEVL